MWNKPQRETKKLKQIHIIIETVRLWISCTHYCFYENYDNEINTCEIYVRLYLHIDTHTNRTLQSHICLCDVYEKSHESEHCVNWSIWWSLHYLHLWIEKFLEICSFFYHTHRIRWNFRFSHLVTWMLRHLSWWMNK